LWYDDQVSSTVLDHLATAASALRVAITDTGSNTLEAQAIVAAARAIVDQAELICTRNIAIVKAVDVREDGHANLNAWLGATTNAWPSEATRYAKRAELLDALPSWSDAANAGLIGTAQLQVLANALNRKRLPFAERDQHILLEAARACTVNDFQAVVSKWVAYCDDSVTAPESEDEAAIERRVQLHVLGNGTWSLNGILDAITGANLQKALEVAMPKPCEDDNRTVGQRRHDALGDIALESLANEFRGEVGGERPHVTIFIDAKSGIAHTEQMLVLSSVTRDMILCDCVATSVWLKPNGAPFDVGTPTSAIPARNRRAVRARDKGCRFPGCCRSSRWTDLHHMKHREDGGTHEIENLVEFCRFHHRYTHRKNLKLRWDTDGITLLVEWPNGILKHAPPIDLHLAG
jgi:hypothetical protein